jgi:hypothetical protein
MTSPPDARDRRGAALSALIVVIAACLPYLPTIDDYFVQDDFGVIQLMERRPWTTFFRWFTMPWMEDIWMFTPDEIRPFVALSYVITAAWGAGNPTGHHLLNIAMHAANGLMVMAVARAAAGLDRFAATFAAVVFVLLPVQAESVAWITGRVDLMPTLFYLAAFLAYVRWRRGRLKPAAANDSASRGAYTWSLIWFFIALFSKQNTITLPAALVAYDLIVLRRPLRLSWEWMRPYVPFVLMTAGFLALRYAVAGTVVRESQLNAEGLRLFLGIVGRLTAYMLLGRPLRAETGDWFVLAVLAAACAAAFVSLPQVRRSQLAAAAVFFGLVWWGLGIAPIVVAGYESSRHVYLAAVGWATLAAIGFQAVREPLRGRRWHYAPHAVAVAMLVFYAVHLSGAVRQWQRRSDLSKLAAERLEREALSAPAGSLLIVGVPVSSWEWAVPFVAQPPYAKVDLTERVFLVTPQALSCCRSQWRGHTRSTLERWRSKGNARVVALHLDPRTGFISRLTEDDYPPLPSIAASLRDIGTPEALNETMLRILEDLVSRMPRAR